MELAFRQYTRADANRVQALHRRASQAAGVPEPKGYFSDLDDIESAFLRKGGEFVVGVWDGSIVVMGGLRRTTEDRAEIVRMRVDPDYQRRGFGSMLLRHIERRAVDLGYKTLHLDTLLIQEAAQKLYRRHNYRCIGSGSKQGFAVLLFEKSL